MHVTIVGLYFFFLLSVYPSPCLPLPLRASPRLVPVINFLELGASCMFSRIWLLLHVFPRLVPVACFPASVGARCMFSRVRRPLHVFPRPRVPVACFPARGARYMFSRAFTDSTSTAFDVIWIFSRTQYQVPGTGCMFPCSWRQLDILLHVTT